MDDLISRKHKTGGRAMTRQEAIKLIDTHTVCFYNEIDSPTLQALHMAIEALEQEPKCEDCKWSTWDNNCMVEYRGCRFESKNGE